MASANASQAVGQHRVRLAELFDAEVARHHQRFMAAADVGRRARMLDIGYGTGQSTRDAARATAGGSVLGVDLSAPLLERARRLTDRDGLGNVSFLLAEAQLHRFPEAEFDPGHQPVRNDVLRRPGRRVRQSAGRCEPGRGWCCWSGSSGNATGGPPRSTGAER
jgi:SAM-dependent methyltransferase